MAFYAREDLLLAKQAPLGWAYYFWQDLNDAISWGENSKGNQYKIYSANIISDKVLDTVFNKNHYQFFIDAIEKVNQRFIKFTGHAISVEDICDYINNRADWKNDIDVLLANDIPTGKNELPIPLRKRIQAAVYNKNCIHNFKEYMVE